MKRYDYTDHEKQICFFHPGIPMTFEARDQEAVDVEKEQEVQHERTGR